MNDIFNCKLRVLILFFLKTFTGYASIKDFIYTSLGKLFINIVHILYLYYCLYHLEEELKL